MENLFENFNLEQFANSEESTVKASDFMVPKEGDEPSKQVSATSSDKEEVVIKSPEQVIQEEFKMSLDELANFIPDENKDNKEADTPEIGDTTKQKKVEQAPSSSNTSQLSSLAKVLHEAGAITSEEAELENIKDVNGLVELVTKTVEARKFDGLNEEQKNYLKALEAGVPVDVYKQKRADHEVYNNITTEHLEENENLRASIIKNSFMLKGFSENKANELTKRSIEAGADMKDSQEALEEIKAYTQANLQKTIQEAAEKKQLKEKADKDAIEALKTAVNNKQEILKSVQINSQTKSKILESITTPVGEREGVPVNDVMKAYFEDNDYKIKLHALHVITKGFTDFSKFTNTTKTKAVEQFEKTLNNNLYNPGVTTHNPEAQAGSIEKALENLFK